MAMNKKEQAEFAALRQECRLVNALHRTAKVDPDVLPPSSFRIQDLSQGFLPVAACGDWPRVECACSSSVFHAVGYTHKTTSQNSRRLFSTRLLALRALRFEVEEECAKRLAKIDAEIEKESENPTPIPDTSAKG